MAKKDEKAKGKNPIQPHQDPNILPGQAGQGMSKGAMGALGMDSSGLPPDASGASDAGGPTDSGPDLNAGGPMGASTGGGAGAGSGQASPDQMAELQQLFGKVQGANSQLATKQLISRNELQNMRQQLLTKMFQLMQGAGVNPADPSSVRQFLQELEQKDPALLELFQDAFQVISGQTDGGKDMGGMGSPEDEGAGSPEGPDDQGPPGASPGMSPLTGFQNLQNMSQ